MQQDHHRTEGRHKELEHPAGPSRGSSQSKNKQKQLPKIDGDISGPEAEEMKRQQKV